jgi:high affinity Mn2+ porin
MPASVAALQARFCSRPGNHRQRGSFGGVIGGVQAGCNVQLSSGIVLGAEADITFPEYLASNSIAALLATPRSDVVEQLDYAGSLRGRIGYASGHWRHRQVLAWAGERFVNTPAIGSRKKN